MSWRSSFLLVASMPWHRAGASCSCRGERGKEHRGTTESEEEEIQPWLVERLVANLVGGGFGCVVFLHQINERSSEYPRAELGETTWSAGHLSFECLSPAKSRELQRAAGGFPAPRPGVGFIPSAPGETSQVPGWVAEALKRGSVAGLA